MGGMLGRINNEAELHAAIRGMVLPQVLGAAVSLGIADRLDVDGSMPVARLAELSGVPAVNLRRLLRFLAALGIFTLDDKDLVGHTSWSVLLRNDAERSVASAVRFWTLPSVRAAWGELTRGLLDEGVPFERANGAPFFAHLQSSPTDNQVFHALMQGGFGARHAMAADALPIEDGETIVDVGGGGGPLLRALLLKHPAAQGTLFDLPNVVGAAAAVMQAAGIGDRCRIVGGDFFDAVPADGNVYVLSWVLHDWGDAEARRILATTRAAMTPAARLLIVERLLHDDPRRCAPYDLLEDLNMLVLFQGRERTESEFNELLAGSGFGPLTCRPTRPLFVVLEARPV